MSISKILDLMNAPYGVYAVDMNQNIVFWNHSAERILGYKRDEVIGRPCYQVCASVREGEAEAICLNGCPSIRLAREGITPPVVHVLMLSSSGERKPVTVTPIIIHQDESHREDERILLVHLFHERTEDDRAETLAQNFHSVFSTKGEINDMPREKYRTLTDRELEVLRLLAMALKPEEIAERLELSPHTILNHIRNVRLKLNARNRLEAVVVAQREKLI